VEVLVGPELDMGTFQQSAAILVSEDVKDFRGTQSGRDRELCYLVYAYVGYRNSGEVTAASVPVSN